MNHRLRQALLLLVILILGCRGEPRTGPSRPKVNVDDTPPSKIKDKDPKLVGNDKGGVKIKPGPRDPLPSLDDPLPELPTPAKAELYEMALLEAVDFLADKKYKEALAALEKAQKYNDTGAVQREIYKVQAILEQQDAAEKAVSDVKTVLEDGKADEAARLASQALNQYGGGEQGSELSRLKREADSLITASSDDTDVRRVRLVGEATKAIEDGNLRSAAVSLEQALLLKPDEELEKQLDDVRVKIRDYDENRRLAAEARRDASRMDEALARLEAAKKSWNTLQVQQEIDEVNLIAARKRDRLTVADFEVRGDVGVGDAGRIIAEELLPQFKGRYDLVERAHLSKVMRELEIESNNDFIDSPDTRREFARMARVRYMVVGSLTPLAGVTLHARLVEVPTGLIVQTARISAPNVEELVKKINQIAVMLQMNDEQKADYEARLIRTVEAVKPVDETPLVDIPAVPPPPPMIEPTAPPPPPPIITYTPRPVVVNVQAEHFNALPPVYIAPPPPPPAFALVIRREDPRRHRLLRLSLDLGDNCYRRGLYHEANRHFGIALSLAGPRREITLRLDNCRRFVPPPPPPVVVVRPVMVLPPPPPPTTIIINPVIPPPPPPVVVVQRPVIARPRVAVFGFHIGCRPGLVPPATSDLIADQFGGYCRGSYEIIDRGEVCWFMGRLNLTMREVLNDPISRRCLAEALNARYFIFGSIMETASFNVETHLVDANAGDEKNPVYRAGSGKIHVKDLDELKLRLGELAQQIGAKPDERTAMAKKGESTEKALNEARGLLAKDPAGARKVALAGLKDAPDSVALQRLALEAEQKQRQAEFEATRRKEAEAMVKRQAEAKKQQEELARQAALARARAEAEAKDRDEKVKAQQKAQRERAAANLELQAKQAAAKGDYTRAVSLLNSASTLNPSDGAFRALASARLEAEKAQREKQLAAQQTREKQEQKKREDALARLKTERDAREKVEAERKAQQEARDKAMYDAYYKEAKSALEKKEYDKALAAVTSARRFRTTDESLTVLREAEKAISLREGAKKSEAEKKKLQDELDKRDQADAKLKKDREAYLTAMNAGQKAAQERRYADAVKEYEAARKIFSTDQAKTGLQTATRLLAEQKATEARIKDEEDKRAKKAERLKALIDTGRKAFSEKKYDAAVKSFREARVLEPGNVDVAADLARTERAIQADKERIERDKQTLARQALVKKKLEAAKVSMGKKQYKEAEKYAQEAVTADPTNAQAKDMLVEAQLRLKGGNNQKLEDYKLAMSAARGALKKGDYKGALNAYNEALRILPEDKVALNERDDIVRLEKRAQFDALIKQATAAMRDKKYTDAVKLYDQALVVVPGDPVAINGKKQAVELEKKSKPDPVKVAYLEAMNTAQAAFKAGKYGEAAKAYQAALKAVPNDKAATTGLGEAVRLEKEGLYKAWMTKGTAALKVKNMKEAEAAFDEALKLKPNDAEALKGKKLAMTPPEPDPKVKAYQTAMNSAQAAMKAGKYAEAVKLYQAALKVVVNDKAALSGLEEAVRLDKEAQYTAWMQQGNAALKNKKLKEAEAAFDEALKIKPNDAAALKGKKAAQTPPEPDPKVKAYQAAMRVAQVALKDGKYAEAIKAYQAALKVMPDDKLAANGLAEAVRLEKEGLYKAWMTKGSAALKNKQLKEAEAAFDEALKIKPGDAEAIKGKKAATTPVTPPVDPKKKAYQSAMSQAQALVKSGKYVDAIKAYQAALKEFPDDKAATIGLAEAITLEKEGRYAAWMQQGNAALKAKKLPDAAKAFDEALKIKPGDAEAIKGKKAATPAPEPSPQEKAYSKAMNDASAALKTGKYAEAVKAFQAAMKEKPGDPAAVKGFQEAVRLQRDAAYTAWMQQGNAALKTRKFADAIKAFDEALKIKPGDAAATKGKNDATTGGTPVKPKDPDKPADKPDYAKLMQQAKTLETGKKFEDAALMYRTALKLVPGDFSTNATLRNAQLQAWLGVARNEHAAKDYTEAVKAYEEALKRNPANAEAKAGLARAKAKKP